MRTMKLAPSVFSAGIGNLSQQLKILEENNVELLHVDVMDGHFVEKMAFGPDHIKMLKELTTIPLDVHLMIEKPERKLDSNTEKQTLDFRDQFCHWILVRIISIKSVNIC